MKSAISLILILLLLAGCSLPLLPTEAPAEVTTAVAEEPTVPATQPPTEAPTITYTLYLPDGNAEHFVTQTVWTNRITADSVLIELQRAKLLPETVIINAFGSEGSRLNISQIAERCGVSIATVSRVLTCSRRSQSSATTSISDRDAPSVPVSMQSDKDKSWALFRMERKCIRISFSTHRAA